MDGVDGEITEERGYPKYSRALSVEKTGYQQSDSAVKEIKGTYHLHGKTGNSSWKIKWIAPFGLGSFREYGL